MKRTTTRLRPGRPRPAAAKPFVPPYSPSWFDRMRSWVDRGTTAPWMLYSLVSLASVTIGLLVQWREGAYTAGFIPFHILFFGWSGYLLGLMHALDRMAIRALDAIRPLLPDDPARVDLLRWRLTVLPRGLTLGVSAGSLLLITLILPIRRIMFPAVGFAPTALSYGFCLAVVVVMLWINATFLLHTARQMIEVGRITARELRVELFHIRPVYRLAGLTGATAAAISLNLYLWFAAAPSIPDVARFPAFGLALFSLVVFAAPLWTVHQRLAAEKDQALLATARNQEAVASRLQRGLAAGKLSEVDQLHKALAALQIQTATLEKIPTWPWHPGTLRGLLAALGLPIGIWLIQRLLERYL